MAEYIEKQAVIGEILGQPPEAHYPAWYAEQVKALPPADVRPVVRGKWLHEDSASNYLAYKCSVCGTGGRLHKFSFCSQCGADMREVEEDG